MQGHTGNIFYAFHELDQQVVIRWPHRRKAHPTVAHHDGGNAMMTGWRHAIGPGCLAVVVGVYIDKSWGNEGTVCVHFAVSLARDLAHFSNLAILNSHIGGKCFASSAVDHGTRTYYQIMLSHAFVLSLLLVDVLSQKLC